MVEDAVHFAVLLQRLALPLAQSVLPARTLVPLDLDDVLLHVEVEELGVVDFVEDLDIDDAERVEALEFALEGAVEV